jgi:predicted MFS family arabinose efflux permease
MSRLDGSYAAGNRRRANAALAALSLGTFTFVTIEVLPVGLLTVIAGDFGRSRSSIGLLVTAYALVVIAASLPLTRITSRVPRRPLLGVTLVVSSAATALSAAAPSYPVLLAARLVTALGQALFWSVVVRTAAGLFPPELRGRAVARFAIGTALAPILGVPAGTWLGQRAGWRAAFLVAAALALVTCVAITLLLPSAPSAGNGVAVGRTPDRRAYWILVVMCATAVAGALTVFTYITPFLLDVTGFTAPALGPLLLLCGVAGVTGTLAIGRTLDRHPRTAIVVPVATLTVAAAVLYVAGDAKPAAVAALWLYGMAFNALATALQNRVLQVAPGSVDIAVAGISSAFNLGIATGSALGGLLIPVFGTRSIALAGALLLLSALVLVTLEPSRRDGGAKASGPALLKPTVAGS